MGAAVAVPMVLTAVSTAVAAYGAYAQKKAQADAAEYQSEVAELNQQIAESNAQEALDAGVVEERQQRLRTQQLVGEQRSGAAARGVLVDDGSTLQRTEDIAEAGEFDALQIRRNAQIDARNFRRQGFGFEIESDLAQRRASSARKAAPWAVAGTLLSGASSVSSKWYGSRGGGDGSPGSSQGFYGGSTAIKGTF